MDKTLENAQNKFISYAASLCDDFGLNRFVAQLYGILYMSDKPLSLDELAKRLGASKGNVSINIRELERWGAVKNVWVKGSRKDYYEADTDLKKVITAKIKSSIGKRIGELSNVIDEIKGMIKNAEGQMNAEEKAVAKLYAERLKKIEDIKGLATTILGVAEKFL